MTKKSLVATAQPEWMTIVDIAQLAGVSVSTVSRALNDNPLISLATRQKVQEIARENSFSVNPVARSLRSKQSRTISVIITLRQEKNQPLYDPFWMTMLAHLAEAVTEAGYDMLLSKQQDGSIEKIRNAQRPAGLILIGQHRDHASIERAARAGCPLIVWGAKLDRQSYPSVGSNNRQGGALAANHLIACGCRRIAFLGEMTLPEISQRYEGYLNALRDAGLPFDPDLVVPAGFQPDTAHAAAAGLIAGGVMFDAIMAASDVIAISAIRALNDAGRRVPEDVSVVGFDDIGLASFSNPPLTTLRQDFAEGARLLVKKLGQVIAGQAVESIEMPSRLVLRQSTRA